MISNLSEYKDDLKSLIKKGNDLHLAMQYNLYPEETRNLETDLSEEELAEMLYNLPSFNVEYQAWYSEAKAFIKQILPDRYDDFVDHYKKPKSRKKISFENYRIEDYLQGLNITRGIHKEKVVGPDAALPHIRQQVAIIGAARSRFKSKLFDIQQLVQADLFDSELDAAKELLKHKFIRAAGAVSGVVLEKHLGQVCKNHNIKIRKSIPAYRISMTPLKKKKSLKCLNGDIINTLLIFEIYVTIIKKQNHLKIK